MSNKQTVAVLLLITLLTILGMELIYHLPADVLEFIYIFFIEVPHALLHGGCPPLP